MTEITRRALLGGGFAVGMLALIPLTRCMGSDVPGAIHVTALNPVEVLDFKIEEHVVRTSEGLHVDGVPWVTTQWKYRGVWNVQVGGPGKAEFFFLGPGGRRTEFDGVVADCRHGSGDGRYVLWRDLERWGNRCPYDPLWCERRTIVA